MAARKFKSGLRKSTMSKKPPKAGKGSSRGPYTSRSDVKDPDQLGAGGIRLRQHRLARGWTMEVTAERAGLSTGTIGEIEAGYKGYGPDTLLKLADAFGVTIGELFDVDPRQTGPGGAFWPLWQQATPAQRQRITDLATGVVGHKK